jgi:hypothetical protein
VVAEVGDNNIVHIVSKDSSNYKKACWHLMSEYSHIALQPCLAHSINIMLKSIGDFEDHESIIDNHYTMVHFRQHMEMWAAGTCGDTKTVGKSFADRKLAIAVEVVGLGFDDS